MCITSAGTDRITDRCGRRKFVRRLVRAQGDLDQQDRAIALSQNPSDWSFPPMPPCSLGSVGDSYDNALAETVVDQFKTDSWGGACCQRQCDTRISLRSSTEMPWPRSMSRLHSLWTCPDAG